MFKNKALLQNISWPVLMLIAGALLVFELKILSYVFTVINSSSLIILLLLIVGIVSVGGGYVLTERSRYEVFPTVRQIIGSLINGIFFVSMLAVLIQLVKSDSSTLPIILFLFSCVGVVELISIRVLQRRKITLFQFLGTGLLVFSVYLMAESFPLESIYLYLFVGFLVLREINSRISGIYLLSPWVNSIWSGVSIIITSLVVMCFVSSVDLYKGVTTVLNLPLWVGLAILLFALIIVFIQFFRRKVLIARGYLQYKLQAWTVLMFILTLFTVMHSVQAVVMTFLIIFFTFSIIEERLIIKE